MQRWDKFKYTNYKVKFAKLILPFLNVFPRKIKKNESCIYDLLKNYKTLNVIASGPSLRKLDLEKCTEKEIFLTTNSSYLALKGKKPFVHLINDHGYLLKYLIFDLKYKPELIIILNFTSEKPSGLAGKILNETNNYLYRRKRKSPIVMINFYNLGVANNRNYLQQMQMFKSRLEVQSNYSNSGQVIYTLGAMLLANGYVESMKVYGIDAGEGGTVHFDGRKTANNHSAFRDKNKKIMGDFFELCQTKFPEIKNYSYFKNNTDK